MIEIPDPAEALAIRRPPVTARRQISLIIPVFNSATSLRELHQSIMACTASADLDLEIVYVDDASTDGSLEILRDLATRAANIVVVEQARNRGQSKTVLKGILAARSQIVVTLDDDLQHNPEDIPRLLAALESSGPSALAIGVADRLKRPLWRGCAGLCANAVSNLFLARPLPLQLTTLCAFYRQLCAGLDPDSNRDLPLMTALVQAAEATVTVPVRLNPSLRQSRYSLVSLVRLFLSRSHYFKLPDVLVWLAGVSLLMAASDALWLTQAAAGHPILTALLPIGNTAVWLVLVGLAIKVGRAPRAPNLGQAM